MVARSASQLWQPGSPQPSDTGPALPGGVRRCGRPSGLCHLGFNPPRGAGRGAAGGGASAHGWWSLPSPAPPSPSTTDEQEGAQPSWPASWEKGWR